MSIRNQISLKALELNDELKKHPLILAVKTKEKIMLDDEQVILKIMTFQKNQDEINHPFNHSLEYEKSLEKKLAEAKHLLYAEPKVNDYLMAYKNARLYLKDLTAELFGQLVLEIEINVDPFTKMQHQKHHVKYK